MDEDSLFAKKYILSSLYFENDKKCFAAPAFASMPGFQECSFSVRFFKKY